MKGIVSAEKRKWYKKIERKKMKEIKGEYYEYEVKIVGEYRDHRVFGNYN